MLMRKILEKIGRTLEVALTGQSHFSVITSEFRDAERVDDRVQAKRVLEEARHVLRAGFGIEVRDPVVVELISEAEESTMHYRMGCYQQRELGESRIHTVYVRRDQKRTRCKAILAHELVHAYEKERGILKSEPVLREGFARWVEYKVLQADGEHGEARRLLGIRQWRFGRGLKVLQQMERERGVQGVLEYVRSIP